VRCHAKKYTVKEKLGGTKQILIKYFSKFHKFLKIFSPLFFKCVKWGIIGVDILCVMGIIMKSILR
jgi:hypothetical protein